jgi:TRAP-type uncharacterized transport system fused permease subunit
MVINEVFDLVLVYIKKQLFLVYRYENNLMLRHEILNMQFDHIDGVPLSIIIMELFRCMVGAALVTINECMLLTDLFKCLSVGSLVIISTWRTHFRV